MDTLLAPALAATGIVGLFSAAAVLIVQLFRQNGALGRERDGQIKDLKADIASLKAENYACKLQVNSLVNVLRQEGIPLPEWLIRDGDHA